MERTIRRSDRGGLVGWAIVVLLGAFLLVPLAIWGVLALMGHAPAWEFAPVGFFFFPFGFLFFLLFLFLLFRLAWWGAGWGGGRWGYWRPYGHWGGWPGGAEEIARQRYARGEITREQYTQILNDLRTPR
jgi:hypothetical protein